MPARVWVGGEGKNELGDTDEPGVVEALLQRVRRDGWECAGKTTWRSIRKFKAGGALGKHGDFHNVRGLVFAAWEQGADAIAFVRDVDSDEERESAIEEALAWICDASGWPIEVIGGAAKPALEGWILALRGHRDTDGMSRTRTREHLVAAEIELKGNAEYLDVVASAALGEPPDFGLPPGTTSLQRWLARAREVLDQLVDGVRSP